MAGLDAAIKSAIVGLMLYLAYDYSRLRDANESLSRDVSGLNVAIKNVMDTTRNAMGQVRAEVQTISLSREQAKDLLANDIKKLKDDFGFRVNGLRNYIEASPEYRIPVIIEGKDTVIYKSTEKVFFMNGRYKGKLYTKGDSLLGGITIADTIRITISKGKRDKWWTVWKKRPIVTNAFLSNPDGTIVSLKSIVAE